MKFLEKQQSELESVGRLMESKQRIFPMFYFISTADLLDVLANGNNPVKATLCSISSLSDRGVTQLMTHMSKCLQAIDKPKLDDENLEGGRPKGLGLASRVGTEYIAWEIPMDLQNKVEQYMNDTPKKEKSCG